MTISVAILDEANALTPAAFIARFGALFEHSPWVVERAAALRPFTDLHEGLMRAVYQASPEEQLALIRAHPELAGREAVARALTAASTAEQASAGLDQMSEADYSMFRQRNAAYAERFGFPFIICVRLVDKAGILAAMAARLHNTSDVEIANALAEIAKIVRLRLEALP